MRYIKTFEKSTNKDWDYIFREMDENYRIVSPLLGDYLAWIFGTSDDSYDIESFGFHPEKDIFYIVYTDPNGEGPFSHPVEDYNEMIRFLEDPEFVKATKKYNV